MVSTHNPALEIMEQKQATSGALLTRHSSQLVSSRFNETLSQK